MMDDKVRPLHAGITMSQNKQQLFDTVANAHDELAVLDGKEPVAVVFAFVTVTGGVRTGYHTLDEVDGRNCLYITRGITALAHDLIEWDKGGMK